MIPAQQELMSEIWALTSRIMDESPGLYRLLHETPLFLSPDEQDISVKDFEQYMESLKIQYVLFREQFVCY